MTSGPTVLVPGGPPGAVPAIDFETTKEIGFYHLVWRRFLARRVALFSGVVMAVLAIFCYLGPALPFAPEARVDLTNINLPPLSPGHVLGTDDVGRDLLRRIMEGGQISLAVGVLSALLTVVIATLLGALSGFFGGFVDSMVTGVTNAFLAIPSLLILVIFAKAFGQTVTTIVIGIALLSWPVTARIVRSVVLSVREKEFVEAARAVGTSRMRIMLRHLIPNALGPIVVSASLTIGVAILTESALSFLGLGIAPPTATWGSLLNEGRNQLSNGGAGFFYALWPGLCILLTVLAVNYMGDALRDAFDPRSIER